MRGLYAFCRRGQTHNPSIVDRYTGFNKEISRYMESSYPIVDTSKKWLVQQPTKPQAHLTKFMRYSSCANTAYPHIWINITIP